MMAEDGELWHAKNLMQKFQRGTCTEEELAWLESWYVSIDLQANNLTEDELRVDLTSLKERLQSIPDRREKNTRKWIAAAAILLFLSIAGYFINLKDQAMMQVPLVRQEILPGTNKATLRLANGKSVDLQDDKDGIVVTGENIKYADGKEVAKGQTPDVHGQMDSLQTPRGGQYKIKLSDGTRVWLNANTLLEYPDRFEGGKREVRISGEAYFEVADSPNSPFFVLTKSQEIRVMGTSFNVASYQDDAFTTTTLVSGKVKIQSNELENGQHTEILGPGEEAVFGNGRLVKRAVNTENVTSWKDGYFKLDGGLKSFMGQVARWYDVHIRYENNFNADFEFLGKFSRDKPLKVLLESLEAAGNVHFKINGREVVVMK